MTHRSIASTAGMLVALLAIASGAGVGQQGAVPRIDLSEAAESERLAAESARLAAESKRLAARAQRNRDVQLVAQITSLPGVPECIAVRGSLAFVGTDPGGLSVLDISNPQEPLILSSYRLDGMVRDLCVVGDQVWLTRWIAPNAAGTCDALVVLDVTYPSSPTLRGTCRTPTLGMSARLRIAGNLAYLAGGLHGMVIVDLSSPAQPVVRTVYDPPGPAKLFDLRGTGTPGPSGTKKVKVTEIIHSPGDAKPLPQGVYLMKAQAMEIFPCETLAYSIWHDVTGETGGLWIIDASDLTSPTLRGFVSARSYGAFQGLWVSGRHAYLGTHGSGENGLLVFDVADPGNPSLSGFWRTPDPVEDIVVADGLAYVLTMRALVVFDVTVPAVPLQLVEVGIPSDSRMGGFYRQYPLRLAVVGDTIYITNEKRGILVLKCDREALRKRAQAEGRGVSPPEGPTRRRTKVVPDR